MKNIDAYMKIKSWYMTKYEDDELGKDINENITFYHLYAALENQEDIYNLIGVNDSIVRERCFEQLSKILNCSYSEVFDKWLESEGDH